MRLLLDQGTPRTVAVLLRQAGFDAVHTAEIGMAKATDREILGRASADDRIVVTLDADFHALLVLSGAGNPSIIRIRLEGLRAEEFSILLQDVMSRCRHDLQTGAMISVQENRVRVRSLPIA